MTQTFKISAAYWDKLSDKEKYFLQVNCCDSGVAYCKRILALANKFPFWDDIVSARVYLSDIDPALTSSNWLVFYKGKIFGTINKTGYIGINERIAVLTDDGYKEIWNNWKTKNPNASQIKEIAQYVQARIA